MATKKKHWGLVPPMPGEAFTAAVQGLEALGLEGVWSPQLYSAPFVPLAAASQVTRRLKLGTGVALAFTRSPLETACNAIDLDLLSGGRCVLGIGPSIRWWNESHHGVEYGKPIAHLKETIEIVRMVIAKGHTGELRKYEGEYYQLDFEGFRTLAPPLRTEIPIYVPAVYETACRVAGRIADGLPGHPIWCESWIRDVVAKEVRKGLDQAKRDRRSFDLNVWLFVAPGPDKKECIEDARRTCAFYAQMEQYRRYYAACGFEKEAIAIHEAAQRKDDAGMLRACTDDMVDKFTLAGPPDQIRARLDRIAEIADSFTLCVPFYGMPPDKAQAYAGRISDAFHG